MKNILTSALCILCTLSTFSATRSDSIRAKLLDPDNNEVLVAVHRGDWRNYAENSIEGINSAIEMGADIIEIDIRKKYNINIIAIKENGKINATVMPNTILTENKTLFVLGEYKALQKCFNI